MDNNQKEITIPSNYEVMINGELIFDYPCDWDPVNNELKSNGSIQAKYKYNNKNYLLFFPFSSSVNFDNVYNPDMQAREILD